MVKKRNQTGSKNKRYKQFKYVLFSGLHLIRVTCSSTILGRNRLAMEKKTNGYIRGMFKLKFHVPKYGLQIKFKCQILGYIFQIITNQGYFKYFAIG